MDIKLDDSLEILNTKQTHAQGHISHNVQWQIRIHKGRHKALQNTNTHTERYISPNVMT